MSTDYLKKQAKNLKRLWPEFAQANGNSPSLAACQELIARCSGFPSWHAAVTRPEVYRPDQTKPIRVPTDPALRNLTAERVDGNAGNEHVLVELRHRKRALESKSIERLDQFLEANEGLFEDGGKLSADEKSSGMQRLAALCVEIVRADPDFMDGYAHLVAARLSLGKPELAIEAGQGIFDLATLLIGLQGPAQVPYYSLNNRPFHRLAHGLVLSHLAVAGAKRARLNKDFHMAQAKEVTRKMLEWWPDDNMGFRLL